MKKFLLAVLIVIANSAIAQSAIDTTIKVDLLRAPASPASNLLGFATSDVDRPTDVSAFMLSLQSATTSATIFPSNYAVDIAPYWFFKNHNKGDITTEGFRKSSGGNALKQSLVFSFAIKNPDSTESVLNRQSTYTGFGFKFSFLRGVYDQTTNNALDKIKSLQDQKLRHLGDVIAKYKQSTDPDVLSLQKQRKVLFKGIDVNDKSPENIRRIDSITTSDAFVAITKTLSAKLKELADIEASALDSTIATESLDKQIQEVASNFQTARVGWTWDVSGGLSSEFRNKRYDISRLHNAGLWTTFGYTDTVYGAGLVLLRYLYNPDQVFAKDNAVNDIANISTFDAGLRYIYAKPQGKFSASIEAIYRSALSSNTIDPSWRLLFNADYQIWQNQKLTFSFGRNFDGTVSKDGNLIAALTFLTGFGNKR